MLSRIYALTYLLSQIRIFFSLSPWDQTPQFYNYCMYWSKLESIIQSLTYLNMSYHQGLERSLVDNHNGNCPDYWCTFHWHRFLELPGTHWYLKETSNWCKQKARVKVTERCEECPTDVQSPAHRSTLSATHRQGLFLMRSDWKGEKGWFLTYTSLSTCRNWQHKTWVTDTLVAAHHILTSSICTHACGATLIIVCKKTKPHFPSLRIQCFTWS